MATIIAQGHSVRKDRFHTFPATSHFLPPTPLVGRPSLPGSSLPYHDLMSTEETPRRVERIIAAAERTAAELREHAEERRC
jgi:hypothetical protein